MAEPNDWHNLHKTLRATCNECHKQFVVTGDRTDSRAEPRVTRIEFSQCESAGLYALEVVCPYCNHTHDLI
jgi:hypothetical protein